MLKFTDHALQVQQPQPHPPMAAPPPTSTYPDPLCKRMRADVAHFLRMSDLSAVVSRLESVACRLEGLASKGGSGGSGAGDSSSSNGKR